MERIFNKEQEAVIRATGGYHLVLAPPGCGKTAVLAERVAWARKQGIGYDEMACLTFTNRAARGMRERIWQRMGGEQGLSSGADSPEAAAADDLFVGNVHRFCSQFLFQSGLLPEQAAVIDTDMSMSILADYLGEDELQVLSEARHRQRYSQIINLQHLMYQCCRHYPADLIVHRDAMHPQALRELCTAFALPYSQDSAIRLYQRAADYRDERAVLSSDGAWLLEALHAAWRYEQYKRRNDLLDFEDLLLMTYDAMTAEEAAPPAAAAPADGQQRPLWRRYRWIQVDEVQDLNPLQLAIIDLFTQRDAQGRLDAGATVVYLGDAGQAIFSFMGAKTDTLQLLRERCGSEGLHNFFQNYRSPQYLLDVFNAYGERQLGIARDLLPTTRNATQPTAGDLLLVESETSVDELNRVARLVTSLYEAHPAETTAVVVAFNSDADEVSSALGTLPHFKISGVDLFSTPVVRTLLAHLSVLNAEQNFIAWAQLFAGLHVYQSSSASRRFVHALMEHALTPVDLLRDDGQSAVADFVTDYERADIVVFDTETTGLNVFDDDVVQLAAVRVREGKVVGRLNLFIETDRPLPAMLGDVENPLIAEYGRHDHLVPADALRQFADFARGAVLLGHNATFDYQIMEHNMRRHAPELSMQRLWPRCHDSLRLARLLRPRLKSYRLKSLLEELGLEGRNSHLADDDIMATLSLAAYCHAEGRKVLGRQLEFLSRHGQTARKFSRLYRELYDEGRARLYRRAPGEALLAQELRRAYDHLRREEVVGEADKLTYIIRYIETDLLTPASGTSLAEQLSRHMPDLETMKEADLCGSVSMQERVFVSTVHKAKGLEFDNVVVFDAVVGKYPSAFADTTAKSEEEARKFYVAISRARRRLIVSWCRQSISRWGRCYAKTLTPYMQSVRQFFTV